MAVNSKETNLKSIILNIQEWLKYLLSKWVYFLIFILIGLGIGYYMSTNEKVLYQAETTFVLEDAQESNPLAASLGLGSSAQGLFGSIDNIAWLYSSHAMISKTLLTPIEINGKEDLIINYFISDLDLLKDYPKLQDVTFVNGEENNSVRHNSLLNVCYRKILKEYLELKSIPKTKNTLSVKFRSGNPDLAIKFSEILVENVNNYYIDSKIGKLETEINNITQKLSTIKSELSENIYEVASSIENIPYANPNLQTSTVPTKKKSIDVQVNTTTYAQLNQTLETLKLELNKAKPLINIVDQPSLPLPAIKLGLVIWLVLGGGVGLFVVLIFFFVKRYYSLIMKG